MSSERELAESLKLCVFRVGDEKYALHLRRVEQILSPLPVTELPGAPDWADGAICLRGGRVPWLDLAKRFSAKAGTAGERGQLLICRLGPGRLALQVDGMSEVVQARPEDLKPASALAPAECPRGVLGVHQAEGRRHWLLDLRALLEPNTRTASPFS